MPLFIAFIRGINVGGRSVKKEILQQAFTDLGFQNIATYKQSGNVIFQSDTVDPQELECKIVEKLQATLGYDVAVLLRTMEELKSILNRAATSQPSEVASILVTFLPASTHFNIKLPIVIPKSTAQIFATSGSEVFSMTHGGGEGALPNPFIESKLKVKTTTRNINVVREIVEKFGS